MEKGKECWMRVVAIATFAGNFPLGEGHVDNHFSPQTVMQSLQTAGKVSGTTTCLLSGFHLK